MAVAVGAGSRPGAVSGQFLRHERGSSPWFAMARNMISIVSHIAFGMVLGLSYRALAK